MGNCISLSNRYHAALNNCLTGRPATGAHPSPNWTKLNHSCNRDEERNVDSRRKRGRQKVKETLHSMSFSFWIRNSRMSRSCKQGEQEGGRPRPPCRSAKKEKFVHQRHSQLSNTTSRRQLQRAQTNQAGTCTWDSSRLVSCGPPPWRKATKTTKDKRESPNPRAVARATLSKVVRRSGNVLFSVAYVVPLACFLCPRSFPQFR